MYHRALPCGFFWRRFRPFLHILLQTFTTPRQGDGPALANGDSESAGRVPRSGWFPERVSTVARKSHHSSQTNDFNRSEFFQSVSTACPRCGPSVHHGLYLDFDQLKGVKVMPHTTYVTDLERSLNSHSEECGNWRSWPRKFFPHKCRQLEYIMLSTAHLEYGSADIIYKPGLLRPRRARVDRRSSRSRSSITLRRALNLHGLDPRAANKPSMRVSCMCITGHWTLSL